MTLAPVHPAAGLHASARKLFEEIVAETTVRKRVGPAANALYDAGMIHVRNECPYTREADLTATLDAWDEYNAYLDAIGDEEG